MSQAEWLLSIANAIMRSPGVVLSEEGLTERDLAVAKVALDLYRKPKSLQLRAMIEEWDAYRINMELY